ncbi:MAG TPA: SDR family NAD(P)-dependent oxidoreductase [Gammaproteobacteria bacterium]|nr:SDR family NAD(P)-dependent oxidoreductase [Gammaproteobacteria bacterium]
MKIAIVTGANRGLGFETSRQLARRGLYVIMACRDRQAGAAAARRLQDEGLAVEPRRVDVTRSEDAQALARFIAENHGGCDVLINNAGVFLESSKRDDERSADPLRVSVTTLLESVNVNALGAVRLIQALAPLLRAGGRIVNVSSGMGSLTEMEDGYLGYRMSKTALNAVTRVFARTLAPRGIAVNSVCPGWVRTDMGGPNATRSVEEGVDTIVWLATEAPDGATGLFWRDRRPIAW